MTSSPFPPLLGRLCLVLVATAFLGFVFSGVAEFPFPGWSSDDSRRYSFLVYGDIQGDEKRQHGKLVDLMLQEEAIAVFNTGDISEDDGRNYQDHFLPQIRPLATRLPFFPSPGNHDVKWGSAESREGFRGAFSAVFDALSAQAANRHLRNGTQRLWYQLRTGNALFLVLDSNLLLDEGKYRKTHRLGPYRGLREEQLSWVRQVLDEAVRDSEIQWKFVFFHHSPLVTRETLHFLNLGGHPGHRQMMMQQRLPGPALHEVRYLLDLFRLSGVTAVFSGHEHYYERWQERILRSSEEIHRINYLVTGTGGAKQRGAALFRPHKLRRVLDDPVFLDYRQRLKEVDREFQSDLVHMFPNPKNPESLFFSYTRVSVGEDEVRFVSRDSNGRIRDQGVF